MSLHQAWFRVRPTDTKGLFKVEHNCNGNIGFAANSEVDEETARLIEMAIEEGKRRRSQELRQLLGS